MRDRSFPPTLLLALALCAISPEAIAREPASDVHPDARAAESPAGARLPAEPSDLEFEPLAPSIDRIRARMEAGDTGRAASEAERFVAANAEGRERDAALMLIGLLRREQERHNLSSEAFAAVASAGGPLAPYAAYYRAEQDHHRDLHSEAIRGCEALRRRWPDHLHAGDCLRIIALSHAALGNAAGARSAAEAYDKDHDSAPISEQIERLLGARLASIDPRAAVPVLAELSVEHTAALTGRIAERELSRLAAKGLPNAAIPEDVSSLQARALSLRESGRLTEAWALFEELSARAPADEALALWVEEESERFGWRTRNWIFLDRYYADLYAADQDPKWTWSRYKVLGRAGRYDEASTLALQMQQSAPDHYRWRRSEEDVARTLLLAKRYAEARAQLDIVAARGGWTGRRAAFEAGFASLMAGDAEDAVDRFTAIVEENLSQVVEARYWRARAYDQLDRPAEAEADRTWITTYEPWSWYASLLGSVRSDAPSHHPLARDGRWAGRSAEPPPPEAPPPAEPAPLSAPAFGAPIALVHRGPAAGFAAWRWAEAPARPPVSESAPSPSRVDPELDPPASYRASALFDPVASRAALAAFAEAQRKPWPELLAVSDLASVGLYDLSGPMFSDWYARWKLLLRRRDRAARKLQDMPPETWQQLFLAARDHHDTAEQLYESWTALPPALAEEAYQLGYPLAHDRYVWTHAREHGLDPFLVLGLMRQESTYNSTARSRVGARGAMQIMPRTGHLLADLAHDVRYDSGDLEDPTVAVGYGIRYLGLLMERFDGVYPLAVASYNGGPFNVSTWLAAAGPEMPLDVFVEHIPYRETRDYVKKVSEGYAAYVRLYGPPSAALSIPPRPRADRPEVVDF